MRYLIDTNIFVYMASEPEYLSKDVDPLSKSLKQSYTSALSPYVN